MTSAKPKRTKARIVVQLSPEVAERVRAVVERLTAAPVQATLSGVVEFALLKALPEMEGLDERASS